MFRKKEFSLVVLFLTALYCFFSGNCTAFNAVDTTTTKHDERYYQTKMCNEISGEMEFVLSDSARVDCLTGEYAIEVDFAKKWAEGIGQSLYYAQQTKRKPAVALIVDDSDERFVNRLQSVAKEYKIKVILLHK